MDFELNRQSEGCQTGKRISLSGHYAKSLWLGVATIKIGDQAARSDKEERLLQAVSTLFKSLEPPEMMINRWLAFL